MTTIILAGILASLWTKQHIDAVNHIHQDFKKRCEVGKASVTGIYPILNTEVTCLKIKVDK